MALDVPDSTPDRGQGVAILSIILMVLIILATVTRIMSKVVAHQNWWWDDLFAILSVVCELVVLSLVLVWRNIGLGYHMSVVASINPEYLITGSKYLFIAIFFFDASVCLPKISAVFFYARVFRSNNRAFRINLWIIGALVSGWLISAEISTIFQCNPIAKAWDTTLPGTCIKQYDWYLSTAILSTVIDFYILILPIPMIWSLKMSLRRRIYLLICFFMTYSVIVLSLGRLVAVVNIVPIMPNDLTWEFPLYLYWSILEGSISIVSISVPSGIALVKAIIRPNGSSWGSSNGSSGKRGSYGNTTIIKPTKERPTRIYGDRDSDDHLVSDVETARTMSVHEDDANIPLGGIKIRTDIRIMNRER
ncbi:hypothetical protein BDV32DRAFT_145618 [Aspergillus pseudonomiae]|uniref:Rhodopsin domain-containing protein n=1 Tax=Aspergillus pseudonomiae TaxID=1506151 RepID=A0A5N6IEY1_9EURO|nr:uncharacterized protein BDV37DRAFT_236973 [Aspergillus pseudonomiae]KAB8264370.1 hypothetical protein BDV32DRAFT_145618 [Aspergillus pseudonomiae]KAE8409222.1 hypothetical protein BDV37DRAFT_236973 [Aspergillus pseudonomiae]